MTSICFLSKLFVQVEFLFDNLCKKCPPEGQLLIGRIWLKQLNMQRVYNFVTCNWWKTTSICFLTKLFIQVEFLFDNLCNKCPPEALGRNWKTKLNNRRIYWKIEILIFLTLRSHNLYLFGLRLSLIFFLFNAIVYSIEFHKNLTMSWFTLTRHTPKRS